MKRVEQKNWKIKWRDEQVDKATVGLCAARAKKMKLNTHNNIVAMEAPKHGRGQYDPSEIEYIFSTAYSGFKACRSQTDGKVLSSHVFWFFSFVTFYCISLKKKEKIEKIHQKFPPEILIVVDDDTHR